MNQRHRPGWQLPAGVTRGLWDYVHSDPIASDYDAYFSENRLFTFDEQVVLRQLQLAGTPAGGRVADLGCGTGRILVAVARQGYRGLAVDLSSRMLEIVRDKAQAAHLPIDCLRANLVELDAIRDESVDAAVCMFSTLGMIRGRDNRHRMLCHTRRILRRGGPFVLHVHNFWYNLYDPGGPGWVLGSYWRKLWVRDFEPGDKFFTYRGIPNMFLHVFTRQELRQALRQAGFRVRRFIPLDPRRHRALTCPWLLGRLRANGWIVVCD